MPFGVSPSSCGAARPGFFGSMMRWKLYTTSSAVTGLPSWNSRPDLSLTVNSVAVSLGVTSSARALPSTPSGLFSSKESYILKRMFIDGMVSAGAWMSRSSFAEPAAAATLRAPPIFGVPAAAEGLALVSPPLSPPQAATTGLSAAPAPTTAAPPSTCRRVMGFFKNSGIDPLSRVLIAAPPCE